MSAKKMPYHRRSGAIPPCSGQRYKRSYRDSYQEGGLAARPQHVGFGKRQHVLGVQRQPPAQDEEPRDERGKAQEEQRDRPPLETGQSRGLLGHPGVSRTPLSFLPRLFFVILRIKSFLVVVVRVGSLRVRGILVGSLLVCALIGATGVRAFRIRILLLDRVPLAHFSCLLLPFQSSGLWRVSTAPPGLASQVCCLGFLLGVLGRRRGAWMAGELAVGETGLRRARPVLPEDEEAATVQHYLSSSGDGARRDQDGEERKHFPRGAHLPTLRCARPSGRLSGLGDRPIGAGSRPRGAGGRCGPGPGAWCRGPSRWPRRENSRGCRCESGRGRSESGRRSPRGEVLREVCRHAA